jgi:hypothetical protein
VKYQGDRGDTRLAVSTHVSLPYTDTKSMQTQSQPPTQPPKLPEPQSGFEVFGRIVLGVILFSIAASPLIVFQSAFPWTPQNAGAHEFVSGSFVVFMLLCFIGICYIVDPDGF